MNIAGQSVRKVAQGSLRSWTMWFAVALAAFGALQVEADHLQGLIPVVAWGWFNIIVAVAVAVLRVITTMPLSDKAPLDDPAA